MGKGVYNFCLFVDGMYVVVINCVVNMISIIDENMFINVGDIIGLLLGLDDMELFVDKKMLWVMFCFVKKVGIIDLVLCKLV